MNSGITAIAAFCLIMLFLIIQNRRRQNVLNILRIKKKNRNKVKLMYALEQFIGKDCIINLGSGSVTDGVVKKFEEGWIELLKKDGKTEIVNIDYVSRIREYPVNKNGKRKLVIE